MSVYNDEKYLKEAIGGILNQTFKDFEFIIINDGSTDKSSRILDKYAKKDKRIKVIHQKNIGLTKSLNKALKLAKGEYVARMDSDDNSLPERLGKQIKFLDKHPKIVLAGTFAKVINEKGEIIKEHKPPVSHQAIKRRMFFAGQICHPSFMFRKKIIQEINGYDENFKYAQDYDLLFRLIKKHQLANIPEFLLLWRESKWGIGRIKNKEQRKFANKVRIRAIKNGSYPIYYILFFFWFYPRPLIPDKLRNFLKKIFRKERV